MFSITPYNVHVGFAHVGDLSTSLNELKDKKRRLHAQVRDIFNKVMIRARHKWGPNGLSGSIGVPGEVPIEKAEEFRDDKKFWQPFFDLYSETPFNEARAYISPDDNGRNTFGRWPSYIKLNFYTETPEDLGFWDSVDDAGKPNGTSWRSDVAKELADFKVEFDKWSAKLDSIAAGKEKEDPFSSSPVKTIATEEERKKALSDMGLEGIAGLLPSAEGIGRFMDKIILFAGIGLTIYVAIQVFPMIKTFMAKPTPVPLPPDPSPAAQLPA